MTAKARKVLGDELDDARRFDSSWTSVDYDLRIRLAPCLFIANRPPNFRSKWIRSFLRRRESRKSPNGVRTKLTIDSTIRPIFCENS